MAEAVIVDAARTPVEKRNGALSGLHPAELLGITQRELLARTGTAPSQVGQVIGGCVTQAGEQSNNVTRNAWLHAGLPHTAACTTIDCACGSSQQAVHLVAGLISAGTISAGIGCGVESMSRVFLGQAVTPETGMPHTSRLVAGPARPVHRRRAHRGEPGDHACRRRRTGPGLATQRGSSVVSGPFRQTDRARDRSGHDTGRAVG